MENKNNKSFTNVNYFKNENQDKFYNSNNLLENFDFFENKLSPAILNDFSNYKDIFTKEQNNKVVIDFYNKMIPLLTFSQAEQLINSHNFTFLKKFKLAKENDADRCAFYTLLYNLGGVSTPQIVDGKNVD